MIKKRAGIDSSNHDKIFNKNFLFKWLLFSLVNFVLYVFIRMSGFQRYPTHGALTFDELLQEISSNTIPIALLCTVAGFLFAKYIPKITIHK